MDIDFSLVLVVLSGVSGAIWLLDIVFLRKMRAKDRKDPLLVEYAKSLFPVFFIVLLLRSFLVEPFKIPSGSMEPTLFDGDFILVNKFSYGIRLPVLNTKIIEIGEPKRGDVAVFRYPEDPSKNYIKRVVALPGDHVKYMNKQLYVNGEMIPLEPLEGAQVKFGYTNMRQKVFNEKLGEVTHLVTFKEDTSPRMPPVNDTVPEGHYFVLGDNRDNSQDSRYWGYLPEENMVGKAFLIWMNFGKFSRIGSAIK